MHSQVLRGLALTNHSAGAKRLVIKSLKFLFQSRLSLVQLFIVCMWIGMLEVGAYRTAILWFLLSTPAIMICEYLLFGKPNDG